MSARHPVIPNFPNVMRPESSAQKTHHVIGNYSAQAATRIKSTHNNTQREPSVIIVVASRLVLNQTLPKQLTALQKRTFTTSSVRMVKVVTSASEFKTSIKSGVSVVDFYATWCGPCRVILPTPKARFAVLSRGIVTRQLMDCANLCR